MQKHLYQRLGDWVCRVDDLDITAWGATSQEAQDRADARVAAYLSIYRRFGLTYEHVAAKQLRVRTGSGVEPGV